MIRSISEKVDARINPLSVHIERYCHEAAVAGAFTVSEQAPFHTVRPSHHAQFRCGNPGAAIIMCVQAYHHTFAIGNVAAEILDLIGVDIGRCRLNRSGEVEDNWMVGRGLQHIHHCAAHFQTEIEFSSGEGFRAVLEMPVGVGPLPGLVTHSFGTGDRDFAHLGLAHPEHDVTPCRADCVVKVDDGRPRTVETFEAGADQIFPALGQYLNQDILGNTARFDQPADEIEFGRTCAGEADFDFFHTDFYQHVEKPTFFDRIHRIDDRLVAIAQVCTEPAGRGCDRAARPLSIGQIDLREGAVLAARIGEHCHDGWCLIA